MGSTYKITSLHLKSARNRYVKRTKTDDEAPKSDLFLCCFTSIRKSSKVDMSEDQIKELSFYVRYECRESRRTTPMFRNELRRVSF